MGNEVITEYHPRSKKHIWNHMLQSILLQTLGDDFNTVYLIIYFIYLFIYFCLFIYLFIYIFRCFLSLLFFIYIELLCLFWCLLYLFYFYMALCLCNPLLWALLNCFKNIAHTLTCDHTDLSNARGCPVGHPTWMCYFSASFYTWFVFVSDFCWLYVCCITSQGRRTRENVCQDWFLLANIHQFGT